MLTETLAQFQEQLGFYRQRCRASTEARARLQQQLEAAEQIAQQIVEECDAKNAFARESQEQCEATLRDTEQRAFRQEENWRTCQKTLEACEERLRKMPSSSTLVETEAELRRTKAELALVSSNLARCRKELLPTAEEPPALAQREPMMRSEFEEKQHVTAIPIGKDAFCDEVRNVADDKESSTKKYLSLLYDGTTRLYRQEWHRYRRYFEYQVFDPDTETWASFQPLAVHEQIELAFARYGKLYSELRVYEPCPASRSMQAANIEERSLPVGVTDLTQQKEGKIRRVRTIDVPKENMLPSAVTDWPGTTDVYIIGGIGKQFYAKTAQGHRYWTFAANGVQWKAKTPSEATRQQIAKKILRAPFPT